MDIVAADLKATIVNLTLSKIDVIQRGVRKFCARRLSEVTVNPSLLYIIESFGGSEMECCTLLKQCIIGITSALFIIYLSKLCWVRWRKFSISQQGAIDLLNLCKETIANRKLVTLSNLMNNHQNVLLMRRLSETQVTLDKCQESISLDRDGKTILVLQELLRTLLDAKRVILSSQRVNSRWLGAAIEQGDMKETFSELLYDLKWHTNVLQSIFDNSNIRIGPLLCNGKLSKEDEEALETAKKDDEMALKNSLRSRKPHDSIERELANQLLEKMEVTADQGEEQLTNGVTSSSNLLVMNPQNLQDLHRCERLGKGSGGEVRQINLLGGTYAIKDFMGSTSFDKERAAIQELGRHPHIVCLLAYSEKDKERFLIMEKMDKDLSGFLKERKDSGNKLSLVEAVVLMLKIAEGVKYIHRMHMAHRDLKPENVLVNVEVDPLSKLPRACSVKITDFGLAKTKEASHTHSNLTWNTGTSRYMAPEVSKGNNTEERATLNAMKADAFSFGIMCSEILTGEKAFAGLPNVDMNQVKASDSVESRPDLSKGKYPARLKRLIQKCWTKNFHIRPKFDEICEELRFIKALLLQRDDEMLWTVVHVEKVRPQVVKQGPWGRNEPKKTSGLFDYVGSSIKWIELKYQQSPPGIGSLMVGYVKHDGQEYVGKHCSGFIGTTVRKIDFGPDEYITQVRGSVAPHEVTVGRDKKVGLISVVSLTIHTNFQIYGPFGDTVGDQFKSGTGEVIGFFGAGGALLDKLGVSIIPDGQEDSDPSHLINQ